MNLALGVGRCDARGVADKVIKGVGKADLEAMMRLLASCADGPVQSRRGTRRHVRYSRSHCRRGCWVY